MMNLLLGVLIFLAGFAMAWRLSSRRRCAAGSAEQAVCLDTVCIGGVCGLLDQTLAGVYVIQDGAFRYVNDRLLEIFGCQRADMETGIETFMAWAVDAEDRILVRENIRRRLSGEVRSLRYSLRAYKRDGSRITLEIQGALSDFGGRPAITGIVLDMTAQRQAEAVLATENRFIAAVLDTVGALVIVLDRQGRVVRCNSECERVSGYRADELVGAPIWTRLLPEDEQRSVQAVFEELLAGNFPNCCENRWLHRQGTERLIAWSNTALLDEHGEVEFVIGTGIDITERHRMEQALKDSEARYRLLFNSGYDAIMVHGAVPGELPGAFIEVNHLACERLGYSREEFRRLTPADIDVDCPPEAYQEIARQLETRGHALFERVHRARDGRHIPVEINTHAFRLHGQPVALSIARDITERKLAEAALRESEARLREITSELGDGIYVLDRNGNLDFMNRAAERMLGWSEQELLGQNAHEIFHFQKPDGTPVPVCECPVYQAMHSGETYHVLEDWFTRKSGELFPVSFVAAPLHREGEIIGSVAAFQDITARKVAEERIRYMAHHDMLTGLPNRALLNDRLEQVLAVARRRRHSFALLFLDLDHFKEINDTFGHDVGDSLLRQVAGLLKDCVRETDTIARMGGDEFVLLLSELRGPDDAEIIADKVVSTLDRPVENSGQISRIAASVGIAVYPDDGDDAQTLIKHADAAMYQVKETGRNGYRSFGKPLPVAEKTVE